MSHFWVNVLAGVTATLLAALILAAVHALARVVRLVRGALAQLAQLARTVDRLAERVERLEIPGRDHHGAGRRPW